MYELRSHPNKKAINVSTYEEAKAYDELCKSCFKRELLISPTDIPDEFDVETYNEAIDKLAVLSMGKLHLSPELVILGKDLSNFESINYKLLLQPYIDANEKLVMQFHEGNEKALNALMGKFLKENKGHDAKVIKETLEEMLKA